MAVTEKNKTHQIPTRTDISDKYKWNLKDLYKSDEEWETAFTRARIVVNETGLYRGKLNDPVQLFACLEARSELSLLVSRLYQYAQLNRDIDSRQSKFQEMVERAAMLSTEAATALSYIEPELLKLSDDQLRSLADRFEKKDLYDFYIVELIRSRAHIRTEEIEELLSLSAMMAKGPDTIFNLLDSADLKYPTIKDEDGREVVLTKQRFAKFMESSDRRVRRDASNAFYSSYRDHANTISATLSTEVNKNIFYARARKFKSALPRALDGDNIPISVYRSLLDNTEANLEGLHRWAALRKRLLKLDEIAPYDMLCPLFPDYNYEVPYDDAVKEVIASTGMLGDEYRQKVAHAFDNRWVDVYETEGKAGGAYSWGNYSSHPFVLMNYNDTVDNMFTLAHEFGHAMHSVLSNETQAFPKAQYSIFVAEVASTLNEGLLMQYLLAKTKSREERLYLLNRQLDNTMGTFFHQVQYARFELMMHEVVESGQALSPDVLSELWAELTKKYYGPALTLDEFSPFKWSRIPHFYMNFYVYQYATSYAASQAILQKIIDNEPGIIDRYRTLLKSGGKDYPINLLKECGIDMTTPDPVEATIKLFSKQVAEMEQLA